MGFVSKPTTEKSGVANSRILEIPFDAFKFPTSDIVQFRALVTPCLHACEPIFCVANNYDGRTLEQKSYGRRRRRSIESNFITSTGDQHSSAGSRSGPKTNEEELVLVQSIKILDSFEQAKNKRKQGGKLSALESGEHFSEELDQVFSEQVGGSGCVNVAGLIMICSMFLLVQLLLIVFWSICWMRRNQQHNSSAKLLVGGSESGLSPYSAFTSSNSSLHSRCLPSLTNAQSTCSSAFAKNHR